MASSSQDGVDSFGEFLSNYDLYLDQVIDYHEMLARRQGWYDHQHPYASYYLEETVKEVEGAGKIMSIRTLDRIHDALVVSSAEAIYKPMVKIELPKAVAKWRK